MSNEMRCFRGYSDCRPCQQFVAPGLHEEDEPASFVCAGVNDGSKRVFEQDVLTLCFMNHAGDDEYHLDLRDATHMMNALTCAMSDHLEDEAEARQARMQ